MTRRLKTLCSLGLSLAVVAVCLPLAFADHIVAQRQLTAELAGFSNPPDAGAPTQLTGATEPASMTTLKAVDGIPVHLPLPAPRDDRVDCNGNGIPDQCDLTCQGSCAGYSGCGQSEDCNGNGVPDECELYGFERVYSYDDGTSEYGLRSAGTHLAWMNRFIVDGDAGLIDAIDLTYVNIIVGAPAMVYLWSDPNGDGEPADAQVLASAPTTTVNNPGGVFRVDLADTYVGAAGTSFFVGTILAYPDANSYPCPLNATAPITLGVSWLIGREGPFDPNDLANGAIEYNLLENAIGRPMNVVVRAVAQVPTGDCNLNGVPDDCDIAAGTSQDLNSNGLPDECEDCNGNGMPDDLDIAAGTSLDCQLDGIPDECQLDGNDCNTDGVPDDCQLGGNDCNGNDLPDECDIASGTSQDQNSNAVPDECEDCNDNGIPDECDLSCSGACAGVPGCDQSEDCQPDGVPDECQWGTPAYSSYVLDDGSSEATAGIGAPGDTAWLNHFTVQEGMEVIRFVDIVYGANMIIGSPLTIYVWSDPNDDGSPADALVLKATPTTVPNSGAGVFNPVDIGDTYIGPIGTSFFVGALLHDDTGYVYPITRDRDDIKGESWYAATASPGTVDPNNLGAAQYFARMNTGIDGNCLIRARAFSGVYPNDCNSNGIPDECDIASGYSQDLDGNGVLDDCEDCNLNDIPDACDVTCEGPCGGIVGCGQSDDCDGNDFPDECDILTHDCNANGIPDTCDVPPLGTYSPDCNTDLIPDECQLAGNDCNNNAVPDECDLGGPPIPQYVLDDGSSENSIGLGSGGKLAWLNRFVVQPNGESLKAVRLAYAGVALGTPVIVYVWNDPNGNGNPSDAHVIGSANTTVQNPGTDTFNYVDIPETYIGPVGTSFFVGAIIQHGPGEFPIPIDQTSDEGESWLAGGSSINPNNLSASSLFGQPSSFGFAGNWLVRAVSAADPPTNDCNGNGIPDECDIVQPSDCCVAHQTGGCSDPTCSAAVIAALSYCQYGWDSYCAQRAHDLCSICAEGAYGTSEDCNANGVPDECDVPPIGEYSLDCNENIVPDECELAERDCDDNGIPDDCQPSDDCDDNGLLDVCELAQPTGLVGQYWRSVGAAGNFSQRLIVRIDPVVDFDWGGGRPHPDVPTDNFAIRWTGLLVTPGITGGYVLYAKADDGVRLWINGELLINEWHSSSGNEYSAATTLLGNTSYHLRMEYYEAGGDAKVFLRWAPPGGTKVTIPTTALRPMQDCNNNQVPDLCDIVGVNVPQYTLDDGTAENHLGLTNGGSIAWLNHFVVEPNGETLRGVKLAFGNPIEDLFAGIYLWSDPNGDGNPADAGVMTVAYTVLPVPGDGAITLYTIPDTYIGPVGTSFFVGAVIQNHPAGAYPAPIDLSSSQGHSWIAGDPGMIDPHDLGAAAIFGNVQTLGFPGNWLVRAVAAVETTSDDQNENGVPDECEDCNGNGVLDTTDVAEGASLDCNNNGLPDECEVAGGGLSDCNANGVPDDCELGEYDCDNNGVQDSCQVISTGLVGQYFNNATFSGTPLVRIDPLINFNWVGDAPMPAPFPSNDFTIRWTGSLLTTSAGLYHFRADRDDGFRLYIMGRIVFADGDGDWISLPANTWVHLRGEFWENSGDARATLYWTPPGGSEAIVPTENLRPLYDANTNDIPDVCELGDCNGNGLPDPLDIDLGLAQDCDANGVPDPCQPCGDCNGNGLLDSCEAETAGLVGQYFLLTEGVNNLSYAQVFNMSRFQGARIDANINFHKDNVPFWQQPFFPSDDFGTDTAVRWTGYITAPATGTYTFYINANDRARLTVNGTVLNTNFNWVGSPCCTEMTAAQTIALTAGVKYSFQFDYGDAGNDTNVYLKWQSAGAGVPKDFVPTTAFVPSLDANGNGFLDACENTDCNHNGIADIIDLANCDGSPWCSDCNTNCIPDQCDLVTEPFSYGQAYWRFETLLGNTIVDSGPNGLNGTKNSLPSLSSGIPVNPVPQNGLANTNSLHLNWVSTTSGGYFSVPDTGGALTMGDTNFTIEAWVNLTSLSQNTNPGNDDRQHLCQKKVVGVGDLGQDYAVLVQRGNMAGSTNYGASATSGRQLQLLFGTGSAFWSVTSNFAITTANTWHYVCVSHDAVNNAVRFVLDDQVETLSYTSSHPAHSTNTGPLLVGAHTNTNSEYNMFVRGLIDEMRISRGVTPLDRLLDHVQPTAVSLDVNGNDIPDECEDCNGNGVLDDIDIASGTSHDYNANGIPDECESACGDLNGDGMTDATDYYVIRAAIGHCQPHAAYNPVADYDQDGCNTLVDYQTWLICYRMANGRNFVVPPAKPDVGTFVAVLLGNDINPSHIAAADMDQNGVVNGADIQPFVDLLLGP